MVLLVEDNPRNLKLARDVLEYAGFRVVVADTGEQGVERAGPRCPTSSSWTSSCPGIDGFAALELLRGHERDRRTSRSSR